MVKSAAKSTTSTPLSSQRSAKRLKQRPVGDNEGVTTNRGIVPSELTLVASSSSVLLSPSIVPSQSPLEDENLLKKILSYVGEFQYRFIGGVNRTFHETYVSIFPKQETKCNASSIPITKFCWEEIISQEAVCEIGKGNQLKELWYSVIQYGKIAVVKYYEVLLT